MVQLNRNSVLAEYRKRIEEEKRTKLTSAEQDFLIKDFVEELAKRKNKARIVKLCKEEIALLEEGYPKTTLFRNQLPRYRNAIAEAVEQGRLPMTKSTTHIVNYTIQNQDVKERQHIAYEQFKYSKEFYEKQRGVAAKKNNIQQDNRRPLYSQEVIEVAVNCLKSRSPYTVAAAIALLTGRRLSEIVSKGTFTLSEHPYTLIFEGQQKKKYTPPPFVIPVLIPAGELVKAIERFRSFASIKELEGKDSKTIDDKTHGKIGQKVNQFFGGVVPVIPGRERLSAHSLRGAYTAIACQMLRAPEQDTKRFAQAILGHAIGEENIAQKNSSATEHYNRFYTVDKEGNPKAFDSYLVDKYGPVRTIGHLTEEEPVEPKEEVRQEEKQLQLDLASQVAELRDIVTLLQETQGANAELQSELSSEREVYEQEVQALAEQVKRLQAEQTEQKKYIQELEKDRAILNSLRASLVPEGNKTAQDSQQQPEPARREVVAEPSRGNVSKTSVAASKAQENQLKTSSTRKKRTTSKQFEVVNNLKINTQSKAEQRLANIVQIFEGYNQDKDATETLEINQSLLTKIGISRPAIKRFLERNNAEIDKLNKSFGVEGDETIHNYGKDLDRFLEFVEQREESLRTEADSQ